VSPKVAKAAAKALMVPKVTSEKPSKQVIETPFPVDKTVKKQLKKAKALKKEAKEIKKTVKKELKSSRKTTRREANARDRRWDETIDPRVLQQAMRNWGGKGE
jgi:hypothetical protein